MVNSACFIYLFIFFLGGGGWSYRQFPQNSLNDDLIKITSERKLLPEESTVRPLSSIIKGTGLAGRFTLTFRGSFNKEHL